MDELVTVATGPEDEVVVRGRFPWCNCPVELRYRPGGPAARVRCVCTNELALGPGAGATLGAVDGATSGHRSVDCPWDAEVELAWSLRPIRPRVASEASG